LKILRTEKEISPGAAAEGVGHYFSDGKSLLKISTLDGYVRVLELQLEGKRRMMARDFLNGYKTTQGLFTII
jgi:methionyl-tRNA formyltransferase